MTDYPVLPASAPAALAAKLTRVLAEVGNVEKKGHNRAQNYDFVRETDLVDKLRPLLAREKLFLHQSVIDHELIEMGRTSSGATQRLTILTVAFTWADAETGDLWPVPGFFMGYGADTGDKGVYKAATGAEKYFLFKTFLVSTGDDPEADEKVDRQPATSRRGPVRVQGAPASDDTERGGRPTKATDAQVRRIASLLREIGLTPDAFERLVKRETGLDMPATNRPRWLLDQPAGLVGKIIGVLTELAEQTAAQDEGPAGSFEAEEPDQEAASGYDIPLGY